MSLLKMFSNAPTLAQIGFGEMSYKPLTDAQEKFNLPKTQASIKQSSFLGRAGTGLWQSLYSVRLIFKISPEKLEKLSIIHLVLPQTTRLISPCSTGGKYRLLLL